MDDGGIGEFLLVWGVGSSIGNMVGVRKCGRRSGEMCGGVEKRRGSKGRCRECGKRNGKVCLGVRVREVWGEDPISSTSLICPHPNTFSHIYPTLLLTPTHFPTPPSTLPHSYHIPQT